MRRIALIGCSAAKLTQRAPACDLYTGMLFRAALAYAQAGTFEAIYVLSAKHGLVHLEEQLDPYDQRLPKRRSLLSSWGARVARQVQESYPDRAPMEVTFLAGNDYVWPVRYCLTSSSVTCVAPLEGLSIGKQYAWLKAHTEAAKDTRTPAEKLADALLAWNREFPGAEPDQECFVEGKSMREWVRLAKAVRP